MGEEGREVEVVSAPAARGRRRDLPRPAAAAWTCPGFTELFAEGETVETGRAGARRGAARPGRHGAGPGQGARPARPRRRPRRAAGPGQVAAAVEFVLEGLYLTRRIDKDAASTAARSTGPEHGRDHCDDRFRYGPWHGGPDPLAPPYDVRAAVDEVGRDVLAGGALREALRDLLRRGLDGPRGLDELRRPGPPDARRARCRRGDLDGTLDQVRGRCSTRRWPTEREHARRRPDGDDARLGECELATAARRHRRRGARRSASYDWRSRRGARATYEQIQDMLRREVLDAQFAGMKQALSDPDPAAMQAVKDMIADLNDLLARHARGEDTDDAVRATSWTSTATSSPSSPQTVDELIDALARRQAAAERMMASLSPEQRAAARPADGAGAGRPRPRLRRWRSSPTTCARCGPAWTGGAGADARRRRAARLRRRRRGARRARRPRGAGAGSSAQD